MLDEFHAFGGVGFGLLEELFRVGGVGLHEQLVTAFGLDEVLEAAVRGGLDVPGEAGGSIRGRGVEAVDRIVARFDGALLLGLRLAHVDGVGDAGGVGEDDGRAIVRFGLLEGLQGLLAVIAEGDGKVKAAPFDAAFSSL